MKIAFFLEIRVTKISIVKPQCLWFGVVILRFARKISYWLSNRLNHFSVFNSTVNYQEVVLFVMPSGNFRVTCRVLVDRYIPTSVQQRKLKQAKKNITRRNSTFTD